MANMKEQTDCGREARRVFIRTMIPKHTEKDTVVLTSGDKPSLNFKNPYNGTKSLDQVYEEIRWERKSSNKEQQQQREEK